MTDYFANVWIAFLTDNIARDVLKRSIKNCPGCKDKLGSPLLHLHEQESLLQKLVTHFKESQGYFLKNINQLYDQFEDHLQHSDDAGKDRESYTDAARHFLLHSTSHSIMYGLFVNAATDPIIKRGYKSGKRKSLGKRKRADKSGEIDEGDLIEQLMMEYDLHNNNTMT